MAQVNPSGVCSVLNFRFVILDGIPEAKRNFFAAEKVFNFWKNGNRGMSGLINMGNTCFLNASIQCLLHTPALYNVLINLNNNNHQRMTSSCMTHHDSLFLDQHKFDSLTSLARLVRTSLHQGPKGAVRPREIVENIRKIGNHFTHGHQECAHEFTRLFMDSLLRSSVQGIS